MVSDQEIANGVENLLRQPNPNGTVTTINGVVQQLEAKLGLDLSHKAAFIRSHIDLLLRSHIRPNPVPNYSKDHFALQYHPQFHPTHLQHQHHHHQQQQQQQQFSPHFALPNHHRVEEQLNFRQPTNPNPYQLPNPYLYAQQQLQQQQQQQQQQQRRQQQPVKPEDGFGADVGAVPPSKTPKGSAPTGTKRRGGPGGLNKVCGVSPELEVIVGEPALPRTQIVKQLWAYIRKHNLQDPSNKRKIICDEPLRLVFETDSTDMFKMNKLLAKHIIPLDPKKEESTSDSKRLKVEVEPSADIIEGGLSTIEGGLSTMVISDALATFLETEEREMVQSDAVARVWDHIRVNNLTDPVDSMTIICDSKLQELFGCESTSLVGISEMLMSHFSKKS